ncbi:hypothetical protein C5S42_01490, partial [Candidatus Methanomarinus sp.]
VTDKEQATKDLLSLIRDKDSNVRWNARWILSDLARYYLNKKTYEKAYQCFYGVASTFKYEVWEYIRPDSSFYLYSGLGSYYHGRTLINELTDLRDPKEYVRSLKQAVNLFDKSIHFIEKSPSTDEADTRFFPLCLNIYSAYYEYYLSSTNLDEKRITKAQNYLDEASMQCELIGTEKGERIVNVFEKLVETLKPRLNEIELEAEKREVNMEGKGIGKKRRYEQSINDCKRDFDNNIGELEEILNEIEAPIIKKIAESEKEYLKKLRPEERERLLPKTFQEKCRDFIGEKWKIIVEISGVLVALILIIEKWDIISKFITNLL